MKTKLIIFNTLTGEETLVAKFKARNEAIQCALFLKSKLSADCNRRYAVDTTGNPSRFNA